MVPGGLGGNRYETNEFYLPHPLCPPLLTRWSQERGRYFERGWRPSSLATPLRVEWRKLQDKSLMVLDGLGGNR